jgi:hypothetical protein
MIFVDHVPGNVPSLVTAMAIFAASNFAAEPSPQVGHNADSLTQCCDKPAMANKQLRQIVSI